MYPRPMFDNLGLTTILLVLLLALPGTAIASEGGNGGEERTSVIDELQNTTSRKEALKKELKALSKIDLDSEMGEFIDKTKIETRIDELKSEIPTLVLKERELTSVLTEINTENMIKLYRYIRYFTFQTYLGYPLNPFEDLIFLDPFAVGAFQIVMMIAALDPFFRAYFEARYGYLFEE